MTPADDPIAPSVPVEPPVEAPIELARLRRQVRADLFGGPPQATQIGRFRLLQCIGRGGMGVVWAAHDDELDRTVAIKLLRPELSGRDLTNEARALARLSHPNVVSVFDVGEHDGQRFIAMEFVEGQTLRQWLLPRTRGLAEVVSVFLEAGRGLAAAHNVGLVHRDFKPDNVLVGTDGRPRVLDFGLARPPGQASDSPPALAPDANPYATTMTNAGLLLGTPAYMAPEQHLGDPADARSDQFAFAVSLYEGLVGTLPFEGDDLRTLSLAIVRGRIREPGSSMPAPVRGVLDRALAVSPQARFPSIEAMLAALEVAANSGDVRFDTRQVDQVLARAAELQAAGPSRPGLSPTEVEAVAVEAGLDRAHARRAASEALAPQPHPTPVALTITPPAAPPEHTSFINEVTVTRTFGYCSPGVGALLVRRIESGAGKGKAEQLGASTTWRSSSMELHLDPRGSETQLVLRRNLGLLAKTRPWRYGALGAFLGAGAIIPVIVEAISDLFPDAEGIIVLFVFASLGLGAFFGRKFALYVHGRELERRRRELSETADRLVALAEANTAGLPVMTPL